MDVVFILYWFFAIVYILFNIGPTKAFKKHLIVFIYIVGMVGFILFASGQIIFQLNNNFIFFNIISIIENITLKSLIGNLILIILINYIC